jgi:integrase
MAGAVNFYLKKPEKKNGPRLIYLKFKFSGQVLVWTFGEKVLEANWNDAKQRVKNNKVTTLDGQHSLNDLLDKLEQVLLKTYRKELSKGIPAKGVLKQALESFINQNQGDIERPSFYMLADRFIKGEIKTREGDEKSKHTTKTYLTVKNHLIQFEKSERYPVDFNTVNLDFYRKYISYLSKVGLSQNTKAKHISVIKTFMNEALDLKFTTNIEHKHKKFSAPWQETDSVYLTSDEVLKLWKHDLSGNKKLENVRDLFVFTCFVGLRYSDASTVKPENIVTIKDRLFIKMLTSKTKQLVIIPANPIVLQIFEKYKNNPNRLPRSISNQKYNGYIKEACKEAGLNEKGRLSTEPDLELWQCVSSHTARRSFATNLYLEGFPVIDLMRVTTHKTESSFLRYLRHSKLDTAKRLDEHIQKQWSSMLLKAVS